MITDTTYLAVVPAYNEGDAVVDVLGSLREHVPEYDVLVVDDGSTDSTGELASAAGAAVVRHPFNLGIGGAVQSGFVYALENDYDYVVQVDGDGQHCPEEIRKLLRGWTRIRLPTWSAGHASSLKSTSTRRRSAGEPGSTSSPSSCRASSASG